MIPGRVSIVIPSRNEAFLVPTVKDLLAKAAGDIEVIAVQDGYWDHELARVDDRRLIHRHVGQAQGMRAGISGAIACARGEFLMKIDGHCMVDQGYDEVLKADCDQDWVVVPRRYSLNPEEWRRTIPGVGIAIDQHYLSFPFETLPSGEPKPGAGLHGTPWKDRIRARLDVLIDDEMSSQGSCWFMTRAHWDRLFPDGLDEARYGTFIQEFQEVGLTTWLSGGRVVCNKRTWYAHLHKGSRGRGYFIDKREWDKGSKFAVAFWLQDRPFAARRHSLRWLLERFWPVPSWPADLDEAFAFARTEIARLGLEA